MATHRPLLLLATVALATAALGACSKGSTSPTEPTFAFDSSSKAMAAPDLATGGGDDSAADLSKRHGDDDGSADDNGGSRGGSDDGTAGNGGNRGNGGNDGNNRRGRNRGRGGRGRGGDDQPGQPQPTPTPGQPRPTPTPQGPRAGAQFNGFVSSVSGNTITLAGGSRIVVNGQTGWVARGDLHSLADISGSLAAGLAPRVEGRGNRQADGSIVAVTIKGEHEGD
jgi:hypothetical protein